jgi:hypothetical protein
MDVPAPRATSTFGFTPLVRTRNESGARYNASALHITIGVEGLTIPVIGRAHLIQNKKAVRRPQDLADAAWLEGAPSDGPTEDAR